MMWSRQNCATVPLCHSLVFSGLGGAWRGHWRAIKGPWIGHGRAMEGPWRGHGGDMGGPWPGHGGAMAGPWGGHVRVMGGALAGPWGGYERPMGHGVEWMISFMHMFSGQLNLLHLMHPEVLLKYEN